MSELPITPQRFRLELRDALLAHPFASPRRQVSRPRRSRVGIGAALTVGAAIVALVVGLDSGGELALQRASAASVLRASAGALQRSGASLALGRGEFLYTKTISWFRYTQLAARPVVVRAIDEQWVGRAGGGRERSRVASRSRGRGGPGDPTRSTDDRLRPTPRPFALSLVPAISLSYAQLRQLPTDANRLRATVNRFAADRRRADVIPAAERQTVVTFAILRGLAETPAAPGVRAALYRVLASTPGIRLIGRRSDSVGRTGTAVAVTLGGAIELELIIDPASGDLLETSRTLLHRSPLMPGYPAGLINRATFVTRAVVDSIHSRPRGTR